jgi:hypothetical protein
MRQAVLSNKSKTELYPEDITSYPQSTGIFYAFLSWKWHTCPDSKQKIPMGRYRRTNTPNLSNILPHTDSTEPTESVPSINSVDSV